jgi:signal transduction histidine kinase
MDQDLERTLALAADRLALRDAILLALSTQTTTEIRGRRSLRAISRRTSCETLFLLWEGGLASVGSAGPTWAKLVEDRIGGTSLEELGRRLVAGQPHTAIRLLRRGNRLVGVLAMGSQNPLVALEIVESSLSLLALGLDGALALDRTRQQGRLHASIARLSDGAHVPSMLQQITDEAREMLGVERVLVTLRQAGIWTFEESSASLPPLVDIPADRFPAIDETVGFPDIDRRPLGPFLPLREYWQANQIRAVVLVPVRGQEGHVCVHSATPRRFSSEEIVYLESLAARISNALEAQRLRRLEDEAVKLRERERKLAGLASMASALAHELNNPVAIALANIEVLGACELPEEERREIMVETEAALVRVARIVARLQGLAPASQEAESRPLDHVARAALAEANDLMAKQRVSVDPELAATPPVRGGDRLVGVVQELLTNAACAGGTRVGVRTYLDGGYAVLDVVDDGRGLDAEARERVFEPFFTRKERWTSIGLGLASCQRIVSQLGGTIAFQDVSGPGTHVVVRLPLG